MGKEEEKKRRKKRRMRLDIKVITVTLFYIELGKEVTVESLKKETASKESLEQAE